jgi:hypothetical protein
MIRRARRRFATRLLCSSVRHRLVRAARKMKYLRRPLRIRVNTVLGAR